MAAARSLLRQRFTRLMVIARGPNTKNGKARWVCRCDCGTESLVGAGDLKSGNTQSCGCLQRDKRIAANTQYRNALEGQRFGRLCVMSRAANTAQGKTQWACVCGCGARTIVAGERLKNGNTQSCGCLHQEVRAQQTRTHGMSGTPVYAIWVAMKMRCTNPKDKNYADYGARGITVCDLWLHSFEAFYADMGHPGPGMTLERKDNHQGYNPENCVYASRETQAHNQRSNRLIPYHGQQLPITYVARLSGLTRYAISVRLQKGLPID